MSGTLRTFIAIELTNELHEELRILQQELKKSEIDAKWVSPENIHLTLKFLGNIDLNQAEQIKNILNEISKQSKPFYLNLSGIGVFPKLDHPRVLWVGVNEGKNESIEIAKKLEDDLEKIGFQKENRPFSPHLTLARIRSSKNKDKLKELAEQTSFTSNNKVYVNKLTLFKSTLTPKGSVYSILHQACPTS
jgi:2'-5' RNA ligase